MAASMFQRNIPVFKQNVSAAFGNSSLVVKTVAVLVCFGYLISFIPGATPYITVTPGYVLPPNFWVWTYFTHTFIEFHFWDVLADVLVVILCGKLLEPLWGAMDMLLFFLITNFSVAIATSFTYLVIYLVSKNEDYLFDTYIHGLAGYIAGFSVAVKQVMPDHVLVTSPFGKLRNTHIPLILVTFVITLRLIGALDGPYPIMFTWGVISSWVYLRFYQKHSNGNRGDMAENFSFASFFPSQVQPVISIMSNSIFAIFVKVKICKKPQRHYDVSSPTTITITLPGTDPQDAERRKNLAIKALNERLSKANEPTANWPSLDEDEEKSSPSSSNVDPTSSQGDTSPTTES
ncbi:hypothetical protein ACF0H5_024057 [Mactra antiquata]